MAYVDGRKKVRISLEPLWSILLGNIKTELGDKMSQNLLASQVLSQLEHSNIGCLPFFLPLTQAAQFEF